jgi:hypothetical protein
MKLRTKPDVLATRPGVLSSLHPSQAERQHSVHGTGCQIVPAQVPEFWPVLRRKKLLPVHRREVPPMPRRPRLGKRHFR